MRIRYVRVQSYRGVDIDHTTTIPFAGPEIVIRSPYPGNILPAGQQTLQSLFYYWGARSPADLSAQWSLQEENVTTTGLNDRVTINIPTNAVGNTLTLTVSAKNMAQEFETAKDSRMFTITP